MSDLSAPEVEAETASQAPSFLRTAFGHGTIYIVGGLASQAIGLLLFPFFAHVLSPHDYGIIDLVALAAALVNLTVALEVSQGLGRYFVGTSEPAERRVLASTALIFTVGTYTVAAAIAFVFIGPVTAALLGPGVDTSVMAIAICAMWCGGILYLAQFLIQYQMRPNAFAVVTVATAGVGACTGAVLVLGFRIGVTGAIVGQLAGCAAGAVTAFRFAPYLYRLHFDIRRLARMLAYSVPLIPASIGVFLNAYADRLAIRSRMSVTEVGVYGAGYRLSMVVSIMLLGLQGAVTPLVLSRHEDAATRGELAHLFRLFSAMALSVFLLVSLFASEILKILTPPAYHEGALVVPFVIPAAFFAGMYVFTPGPNIARRTGILGLVVGLSGVANLLLAYGLVGRLGIVGPALAFLVACAGAFVALMIVSQRLYHVPHAWSRLLPTAVAIGALVGTVSAVVGLRVTPATVAVKIAVSLVGLAIIALTLVTPGERLELRRFVRRSGRVLGSVPRRVLRRRRARHA
jgi:O-antigen/teichoic acid export membrane protein